MAAPLLQAQIDIHAPVTRVWELVSDFGRMPQWSPQCRLMKPLGPLRQGTRTLNLNRRGLLFWPTTSIVIEFIPQQRLAFKVPINGTIWSYELQPIPEGTRLVESRHAESGVSPISSLLTKAVLGGSESFDRELLEGMNASLAKIKAAAENG